MDEMDNAASRLKTVLSAMRRENPNEQMRSAWITALGIGADDVPALYHGLAAVMRLPDAADSALAEIDDVPRELLSAWFGPVKSAMSVAHLFDKPLQTFTSRIDDAAMFSLAMCADTIHRRSPRGAAVDREGVDAARALVAELLEVLRDADIDADARAVLIRHTAALAEALQLVDVVGADGVRDALAGAIGALYMVAVQHPEDRNKPPVTKFSEMVAFVANLVTIGGGALLLSPSVATIVKQIAGG